MKTFAYLSAIAFNSVRGQDFPYRVLIDDDHFEDFVVAHNLASPKAQEDGRTTHVFTQDECYAMHRKAIRTGEEDINEGAQ